MYSLNIKTIHTVRHFNIHHHHHHHHHHHIIRKINKSFLKNYDQNDSSFLYIRFRESSTMLQHTNIS
ncbi:MAG: hypothetical protein N6V49_11685, partial [Serratia symbiotica]|nr:hypothetical protein [Serratia symbiotica]